MTARRATGRPGGQAALFAGILLVFAAAARAAQAPAPVTIVDSLGRKVTIPGAVNRIISLEPEITRIIVALGAGERLVGIDFFLRHHDHLFPLVFPPSAGLPVVSNQGQDLSYEEAIHLRPDVIFVSPSEFGAAGAIERKMRVPVVALASMGRFEGLLGEIGTLGRVLGREGRAAELTALFEDRLGAAGRRAASVPAEARPSVYLSFWGSLSRTPVSYEPVEAAGGRNVASGILPERLGAAGATVSLEKILIWDPDVILVQGNYAPEERAVTVETILIDPRLASLKAVRNRRVHYTFGFWYWWDPALVLVETLYLSRLLHPDGSPAPDLVREGDAIFKDFYGVEGAFGNLCRILGCDEWTTR
jgi:iron complex transport system substrate-binding protein